MALAPQGRRPLGRAGGRFVDRCSVTPAPHRALRVHRFSRNGLRTYEAPRMRTADRKATVRVEYASVGATDVMAANGGYLLHPVPGFTTGYDFVGTVERLPASGSPHIAVGDRVAGILPRMGAHATKIAADLQSLVRVPDAVKPSVAATIPLDAVTAIYALSLASRREPRTLLVQGAGGSVGAWLVQLARANGILVYGTASGHSAAHATNLGARCYDYTDSDWKDRLRSDAPDGVDGIIDHTGDRSLASLVSDRGCIVRTAFGGSPGRQMQATLRGSLLAAVHRTGHPREQICSIPLSFAGMRSQFRTALVEALDDVQKGKLRPPDPEVVPFEKFEQAFQCATTIPAGRKVVMSMAETHPD